MSARPDLTPRQRVVLDVIRQYVAEYGRPPTHREIGDAMGVRSTNGVHDHLLGLERKGFIRIDSMKTRGIVLVHDYPHDPVAAIVEAFEQLDAADRERALRQLYALNAGGRAA